MKFMQRLMLCKTMNYNAYILFVKEATIWHKAKYLYYDKPCYMCYKYYLKIGKKLKYYKKF